MAMIAGPTLVIYVVVLGVTFLSLRAANRREVEETMTQLAVNHAARFDGAFRQVAAVARATASFLEAAGDLTESQLFEILRSDVRQDPLIYGAAIAFEPGTNRASNDLVCPYVYRDLAAGDLAQMNIDRSVMDWYGDPRWQWWHDVKASGEPRWTDPYFDQGAGNVLMVTYSVPFTRDGRFRGVATVDIRLPALQQQVGHEIVSNRPFAILTADGRYVYSANESLIMDRTVFDVFEELGRPDVAETARDVVSGRTGMAALDAVDDPPDGWQAWGERQWVFYAPISSTGWALVTLVPEREALAGVHARMTVAGIALAATLGLIIGCIWFVSGRLARPIRALRRQARAIAGGDLDATATIDRRDEIGDLATAFNRMAADLKCYLDRLGAEQASKRDAIVFALAKLSESRDDDTGKHLERICRYVEIIATELKRTRDDLDDDWVRTVSVTAALHDIGKVGIPDAVLCKPGRLTDDEHKVIQRHATIGGDTLLAIKQRWADDAFLVTATEIAFAHHEKWDGSGYPFGLARDDISLAARIVAVADVYDALTSARCYKKAMPHDQAVGIITDGAGSHFDPDVVDAFLAVQEKIRVAAERLREPR